MIGDCGLHEMAREGCLGILVILGCFPTAEKIECGVNREKGEGDKRTENLDLIISLPLLSTPLVYTEFEENSCNFGNRCGRH
jgi:hypothetical protein